MANIDLIIFIKVCYLCDLCLGVRLCLDAFSDLVRVTDADPATRSETTSEPQTMQPSNYCICEKLDPFSPASEPLSILQCPLEHLIRAQLCSGKGKENSKGGAARLHLTSTLTLSDFPSFADLLGLLQTQTLEARECAWVARGGLFVLEAAITALPHWKDPLDRFVRCVRCWHRLAAGCELVDELVYCSGCLSMSGAEPVVELTALVSCGGSHAAVLLPPAVLDRLLTPEHTLDLRKPASVVFALQSVLTKPLRCLCVYEGHVAVQPSILQLVALTWTD